MRNHLLHLTYLTVPVVAASLSVTACGEDGPGIPGGDALLEECGLVCPEAGVVEGNASISGVASIDGFFGAVGNFSSKATLVSDGLDAELAAIAASVGLQGGAGADFQGEFQTALQAKFNLQGAIAVKYQEPKCAVSAKATIEATAKCDVDVEPGSVKAECSGSCEVDASAEVSCSAEAELKCTGTAPSLSCEGTCTGECELTAAATCEGTCNGTCSGDCTVKNANGDCEGKCNGECQGSCELEAGGSCSGSCKGSCEYTPPSGQCEGGAKAECEATGSASVECEGSCSGEVTPPKASAECEASAKADASVNVECTPPSVDVTYELAASGDATADLQAKAEFEAWLSGFKAHVGAIAALSARAEAVIAAGADIGAAASGAVTGAVEAKLSGDAELSLKDVVGLGCAVDELKLVPGVISDATGKLQASVSATASLTAAIGG